MFENTRYNTGKNTQEKQHLVEKTAAHVVYLSIPINILTSFL